MNQRFLLNREQGKVMGVAAGLADWTGIDALVIRLGLRWSRPRSPAR